MSEEQKKDEGKQLAAKLQKLKIQDPIVVVGIIALMVVGYFYFFPSEQKRKEDPMVAFTEKVQQKAESDLEATLRANEQFQKKMEQKGAFFNETKELQAAERERQFQARKVQELEAKLLNAQEGFPKRRLREELVAKSYYAPIFKSEEASEGTQLTQTDFDSREAVLAKRQDMDYFRDTSLQESRKAAYQDSSAPSQVELRAGTWIPAILNGDIHAQVGGHQRATIRNDVMDPSGKWILIPKGSTAIVQMAQSGRGDGYHLSALAVKEIITPDGTIHTMPIPVHDGRGIAGLDPRKDGKFKRHYLEKIGMTALVAAVSAAPSLALPDSEDSNDLVEYQFIQQTGSGLQGLLRDSLNIPNEKIFKAGAHLNFFLIDSILLPPYKAVYADPNARVASLQNDLNALNKKMFQYEQLGAQTMKHSNDFSADKLQRLMEDIEAKANHYQGGQQ